MGPLKEVLRFFGDLSLQGLRFGGWGSGGQGLGV